MTVTPPASNTLGVHTKLYSAPDLDELAFSEATFPDCTTERHGLKPIEYARSAGRSISHNAKSAFLPTSRLPTDVPARPVERRVRRRFIFSEA
jgi:hypothetical protein